MSEEDKTSITLPRLDCHLSLAAVPVPWYHACTYLLDNPRAQRSHWLYLAGGGNLRRIVPCYNLPYSSRLSDGAQNTLATAYFLLRSVIRISTLISDPD